MSRPVKPRTSYSRDAIVINRIMEAVQVDPVATSDWKVKTAAKLKAAMLALLEQSNA